MLPTLFFVLFLPYCCVRWCRCGSESIFFVVHNGAARPVTMSRKLKVLRLKEIVCRLEENLKRKRVILGTRTRFGSLNAQQYCLAARPASKGAVGFRSRRKANTRSKISANRRNPGYMVQGLWRGSSEGRLVSPPRKILQHRAPLGH